MASQNEPKVLGPKIGQPENVATVLSWVIRLPTATPVISRPSIGHVT